MLLLAAPSLAQRVSDVRSTRHNLSTSGTGGTHAASGGTSEVCVFCHTPHGATQQDQGGAAMRAPLWNRRVPDGATYTPYTSSSLDAQAILDGLSAQPGGSSKLCLSCHDGTLAIGNVNVLNGNANVSIPMTGTGPGGVMPAGEGVTSGFTRFLGTDLRNDHPISVTYSSALAARDGELRPVDAAQRWPAGSGSVIGVRSPGVKPLLPLEPTGNNGAGQVQCATCHDPHIRELDPAKGNQKFLRTKRFQEATPTGAHNAADRHHLPVLPRQELGPGRVGLLGARATRRGQRDLPRRGGDAARVPGRHAGVEGLLPELPRHPHRAGRAPPDARRHRRAAAAGQPAGRQAGRQPGAGEDLLPVPHHTRPRRCSTP